VGVRVDEVVLLSVLVLVLELMDGLLVGGSMGKRPARRLRSVDSR
jgi:hypothetical protein